MRPDGKARRVRIPGVFERGATQPDGMQRPPNAAGLSPRAAKVPRRSPARATAAPTRPQRGPPPPPPPPPAAPPPAAHAESRRPQKPAEEEDGDQDRDDD